MYDIPTPHLKHIVERVLGIKDEERKHHLLKLCDSRDAGERGELFAAINKVDATILPTLAETWEFATRRAVHLWTSRKLQEVKAAEFTESAIKEKRGGREVQGRIVYRSTAPSPADDGVTARVHSVRVTTRHGLDANVRLTKTHAFRFEEEVRREKVTADVPVMLDLKRKERLVEVYAGYNDARKALIAFLEWWTQLEVPKRGRNQTLFFEPLPFGEMHVKALAKRLHLRNVSIRGQDPSGEYGEQQLWGKPTVDGLDALDPSLKRTQDQEKVANKERWYGFAFVHPDGFDERTQVAFNFHTKVPRITFNVRTSRPAVTRLLSELYAEVRP